MQSVSKLKKVEVYLLIDIEKSSRNAVDKNDDSQDQHCHPVPQGRREGRGVK